MQGYADAASWVYGQAPRPDAAEPSELLTVTEVRHVHQLALQPVWDVAPHAEASGDEAPGAFRRHDIHPFPGGMTPPSFALVDVEVHGWLERTRGVRHTDGHLIERLAELHAEFERIHPFLDGNGRTGRLLLNLVLARPGYPPAIVQKRERSRYLDGLRSADAGRPGPLAELLARAVLDNLYRFVVPAVAGPARLVPLEALVRPGVSHVALRNASQRGRLQAQRGTDGRWRSSAAWVQPYLDSRYRVSDVG